MHLQQTKAGSRATGGPQYFFHAIPATIKTFLRSKGALPVVLQTPYGIAKSAFMALGRDHKLGKNNEVIPGRVGHDRIQQAEGTESIGEAIRYWYGLRTGDFERIDVEAVIHPAGHFILIQRPSNIEPPAGSGPLKNTIFRFRITRTIRASFGEPKSLSYRRTTRLP